MKKYWYKLYRKVGDKKQYVGTFKTQKEISNVTNISTHTLTKMINGIYSIYQDQWEIDISIRKDFDIYRDI